jgi:phage-related protein
MSYSIHYYGEAVKADIWAWPPAIRASYLRATERMVENGSDLGLPYTRALGNGLFEIRARGPEGIGRALFCTLVGQRIVILHAFIKKTEQTPHRDLRLARRRLQEFKHG